MRDATLCFLLKDNQILLAMKKRGFGAGRWNGVGGKLLPGEIIAEAAVRETVEEIGIKTRSESLEKVAALSFFFPEARKDWNQKVHVYFIRDWEGEPTESEEMRPAWYTHDTIPFSEMWPDDIHWLPRVLLGEKIEAEFYFTDDGNSFDRFAIREI